VVVVVLVPPGAPVAVVLAVIVVQYQVKAPGEDHQPNQY
jgi:hypothetical protein